MTTPKNGWLDFSLKPSVRSSAPDEANTFALMVVKYRIATSNEIIYH